MNECVNESAARRSLFDDALRKDAKGVFVPARFAHA